MTRSESLYIRIAEILKERFSAPEYEERFIPSEYALQQEFDASRVTVRKALKLLEERGYIRTIQGRGRIAGKNGLDFPLNRNKPRCIACICSCVQLPSYGTVCNTFNCASRQSGYSPQVFFTDNCGLDRVINEITPGSFAGIVCVGIINDDTIKLLNDVGLPLVCIGFDSPLLADSFCTDDFVGGFMAAEHFYKNNHRRIAVVATTPQRDHAFELRKNGFMNFFEKVDDCRITVVTSADVCNAAELTAGSFNDVTGIFMVSDLMQAEVNQMLGLTRDNFATRFSIVGYDNFVNNTEPPAYHTDSISQPWEMLAEQAFRQLKSLIETPGDTPHMRVKIRPRLVQYGSVRTL